MIKTIELELWKLKNSPALLISMVSIIAVFLFASYSFWEDFQNEYWRSVAEVNDYNPWHFFINNQGSRIEFCMALLILLGITWFSYIDYKNNLWFRNLTLPISFIQILAAKMIIMLVFILGIQLILFSFSLFYIKPLISNRYNFIFTEKYTESWYDYTRWFLFYIVMIPKLIIFQFWLTLKSRKSYLMAFFIGFIGIVLKFLTFSPYYFQFSIYYTDRITISLSIFYSFVFFYFIKKEIKSFYL